MHMVCCCVTAGIEASFNVVHCCTFPFIVVVKRAKDTAEVEKDVKDPMNNAVDGCL